MEHLRLHSGGVDSIQRLRTTDYIYIGCYDKESSEMKRKQKQTNESATKEAK